MHIEILKKTRLADNNRCGTLSIFTTGHSIKEIRQLKQNVKLVCFGCDNNSAFYIEALRENGLMPDIVADNKLKETSEYLFDIPVLSPKSLLETPDKYYFIVTLTKAAYSNQVRIQLLLNGVKNFAILTQNLTFDFDRCALPELKQAFFESINEIYKDVDFTENHFEDAKYVYINPIKWWYDTLEYVINQPFKNRNDRISLLDVGPGAGLESLLYQKLLGCKLNWINLERQKQVYDVSYNSDLIQQHGIQVQIGYIEADDFSGEHDIIIFTDIIEHLAYSPVDTLKKLRNMLKDGGYLVLSTPNRKTTNYYTDWRLFPSAKDNAVDVLRITNCGHVYEYSPSELEEIFAESGYDVVFKKITEKSQYVLKKSS